MYCMLSCLCFMRKHTWPPVSLSSRALVGAKYLGMGPRVGHFQPLPPNDYCIQKLQNSWARISSPPCAETLLWETECTACLYPSPQATFFSAAGKSPQAMRTDYLNKSITSGILGFRMGNGPTPISQRMTAETHDWVRSQQCSYDHSYVPPGHCPCAWLTPQAWLWLLRGLWSAFFWDQMTFPILEIFMNNTHKMPLGVEKLLISGSAYAHLLT